jgi:hypothetical protein
MINGISTIGKYMQAGGGYASNPYINMNNPSAGMVRYNGSNNHLEVYDGSTWYQISNTVASVGLNGEAESLLDWARQKRDEELAWQSLAKTNKAVKIALDNVEEARRQLDVVAKLTREHEQTTS